MPHASLTFTLPDEQRRHLNAVHGELYRATLHDIEHYLCQILETKTRKPESPAEMAHEIMAMITFNLGCATEVR